MNDCMPGRADTFSSRQGRFIGYLIYLAVLAASFASLLDNLPDSGFFGAFALAFFLAAIVPICALVRQNLDFVEPIYWFSAMYYLVVPGSIYLILTEFNYAQHILDYPRAQLIAYTEHALVLFIVGYVAFAIGYLMASRSVVIKPLRLPSNAELSGWVGRAVVAALLLVGIANFLYLLTSYPGGPSRYLLEFGLREHRFEVMDGYVTTVGYHFAYAAIYIWMLLLFRDRASERSRLDLGLFFFAVVTTLLMSASQGRVSQTIMYVLSLVTLHYGLKSNLQRTVRLATVSLAVILLAPTLYLVRQVSVAAIGQLRIPSVVEISQHGTTILHSMGYWLIDKGNIPNFSMVVNLVGQNGIDRELWYGKSVITWVTKLSSQFGDLSIGHALGLQWYDLDGEVPPTIIGEMLVNFGDLGVPAGLLLAGALFGWCYRTLRTNGNVVCYFIFITFLVKFFFFWPKGEISNFSSAVWQIVPFLIAYSIIRIASQARIGLAPAK